jgi:hypothetical protein
VEKNNYIGNITGDLMKNPLKLADAYIIGRAETDWGKNPFWEKGSYREWANRDNTKTSDDPASKIIYSGYVDVGKKKLAVINGLESILFGMDIAVSFSVMKRIVRIELTLTSP